MPLPRALVCIGAGAALGWAALLPALTGSAVGSVLGFALARFAFRGIVGRVAARRPGAGAVLRAVAAEGWRVLFLLRLASPVPGSLINFACGVSRIGFGEYMAVTMLGVLPQTLLFVHLGRTGGTALSGGSPWSLDGLMTMTGITLTVVALWRLRLAAKRQVLRIAAEDARGFMPPSRATLEARAHGRGSAVTPPPSCATRHP